MDHHATVKISHYQNKFDPSAVLFLPVVSNVISKLDQKFSMPSSHWQLVFIVTSVVWPHLACCPGTRVSSWDKYKQIQNTLIQKVYAMAIYDICKIWMILINLPARHLLSSWSKSYETHPTRGCPALRRWQRARPFCPVRSRSASSVDHPARSPPYRCCHGQWVRGRCGHRYGFWWILEHVWPWPASLHTDTRICWVWRCGFVLQVTYWRIHFLIAYFRWWGQHNQWCLRNNEKL